MLAGIAPIGLDTARPHDRNSDLPLRGPGKPRIERSQHDAKPRGARGGGIEPRPELMGCREIHETAQEIEPALDIADPHDCIGEKTHASENAGTPD